MTMKFGWHLPCYGPLANRRHLLQVAREAEALGFDSVFVSDHVLLPFQTATALVRMRRERPSWTMYILEMETVTEKH